MALGEGLVLVFWTTEKVVGQCLKLMVGLGVLLGRSR